MCTHNTLRGLNKFSYYGRTVDPEFNYRYVEQHVDISLTDSIQKNRRPFQKIRFLSLKTHVNVLLKYLVSVLYAGGFFHVILVLGLQF